MDWCDIGLRLYTSNFSLVREALKISQSGKDNNMAYSLRALLLISSGPTPVCYYFLKVMLITLSFLVECLINTFERSR